MEWFDAMALMLAGMALGAVAFVVGALMMIGPDG